MATPAGLEINGYGLACSLGLHAPTACAAACAGIIRAGPVDFEVMSEAALEDEQVLGHVAPRITQGFAGTGRLLQLGTAALRDFLASTRMPVTKNTAIFLLLDDGYYRQVKMNWDWQAPDYVGDHGEDATELQEESARRRALVESHLMPSLLAATGLEIDKQYQRVYYGGPAKFGEVLHDAAAAVRNRACDSIIVGAIDSLVDPDTLPILHALGLLKSSDNPVGAMPGEAAGFVGLANGTATGSPPRHGAFVSVSATGRDHDRFGSSTPIGRVLGDCIASIWSEYGGSIGRMSFNLNGSIYRAADVGRAIVHLSERGLSVSADYDAPLANFGDVGVAAGPAMACLVAHEVERGRISGGVLIGLSADDGERGAFIMAQA